MGTTPFDDGGAKAPPPRAGRRTIGLFVDWLKDGYQNLVMAGVADDDARERIKRPDVDDARDNDVTCVRRAAVSAATTSRWAA